MTKYLDKEGLKKVFELIKENYAGSDIVAKVTALEGNVTTNQTNIGKIIAFLGTIDGTTLSKEIQDAIEALGLEDYLKTEDAESTYAKKTDLPDVSNYFDGANYNSATKEIEFKHGETVKATIDASDFIKDGMVEKVEVKEGKLIITWNTAANKDVTEIAITEIFNASNYYNKTEVDNLLKNYYKSTEVDELLEDKVDNDEFETLEATVNGHTTDLTTLKGDENTEGSVKKTVKDAISDMLTKTEAAATYQEKMEALSDTEIEDAFNSAK